MRQLVGNEWRIRRQHQPRAAEQTHVRGLDAREQHANGTSTRDQHKNVAFRPVQNISVASHASVDMEKFLVDVAECCVSDTQTTFVYEAMIGHVFVWKICV